MAEILVPFPSPLEPTTQVRSTLICASIQALRQIGRYDEYMKLLTPEQRADAQALTAGLWLPIERGVLHYKACDRVQIAKSERMRIGGDVAHRIQQSLVSVIVRLTREGGMTPWTVISNAEKLRQRSWVGGGIQMSKLGPKDARLEWVGQPCGQSEHFRAGFTGLLKALCELYARRVFASEDPAPDENTLIIKIAWA